MTLEVVSMTLKEYRLRLKWSRTRLAREAGVTTQTISRIEDGEAAYDYTVSAIAEALSKAYGTTISMYDLGVKIVGEN